MCFFTDRGNSLYIKTLGAYFFNIAHDIGYYFMSGLAMHGKNFIAHPEIHYPDLLQTEFDFERKDPASGFENQKLFLVRYTKDYEVKLVDDDSLLRQK